MYDRIIHIQTKRLVVHLLLELFHIRQECLTSYSCVLDLNVDKASFSRDCGYDSNIVLHQSRLVHVDVGLSLTPVPVLVGQPMESYLILEHYFFSALLGSC